MLGGCGGFARAYSTCQGEFGIIKLFPVPSISLPETVRGPTRGPREQGQLHRLYRSLSVLAKVRLAKTKTPTHSLLRAEGSQFYSDSNSSKLPEAKVTCELCADVL